MMVNLSPCSVCHTNVSFVYLVRMNHFMQDPYECYNISDVEAGLGLRRKQLVAIALLVGNDHDLKGVPGFGVDTAVRFVQMFNEDEILDRFVFSHQFLMHILFSSVESSVFSMNHVLTFWS